LKYEVVISFCSSCSMRRQINLHSVTKLEIWFKDFILLVVEQEVLVALLESSSQFQHLNQCRYLELRDCIPNEDILRKHIKIEVKIYKVICRLY
jgi:hypothetical protein